MTRTVIHDEERDRFLIKIDEQECVLEYRREGQATLDYYHTYVPPELRGQQIAADLATFGLNYAREHHLFVIPSCSYVAAFIKAHPQYQSLVA